LDIRALRPSMNQG